ncbi:HEAT repeat protein [Ancylostoma caninum]|uniref:HEAT repeat protein n=1 Tax=Ancylostoma caninum TaxID=29170 RepID=A0A368HAR2_ANCCA|nr:HEAT repeat protein [Ancylostoma caninum]
MTQYVLDLDEWLDDADVEKKEWTIAIGKSALDRISRSLHGKMMLLPFLSLFDEMRSSADWRERHAALVGISAIFGGCKRAIEPHVEEYVQKIVPYLNDVHPRVRYAAFRAIRRMSSCFAPILHRNCHEIIEIITSHLPDIMNTFKKVLKAAHKRLRTPGLRRYYEQIVSAIGSVAQASLELLTDYYGLLVPRLKFILVNCTSDEYKTLRGKTIESLSLIGEAVGREKFRKDGLAVVELFKDQIPNMSADDPLYFYIIGGWSRICRVLGKEFAPYLPLIMGSVVEMASYRPRVAVFAEDELQEKNPLWLYHKNGNKTYGVCSVVLEKKADACSWLAHYAAALEEEFVPYVDEVTEVCMENLQFSFMDAVRSSAAVTMPSLLKCVKSKCQADRYEDVALDG